MVNPLSRVGMKNIINKGPIISTSNSVAMSVSNLDEREEKLILGLINGEKKAIESLNIKKAITLEEAAKKIKNNF